MKEEWKPIPGYEGYYEVSSHGRVRSVDRKIWDPRGIWKKRKGKMMKISLDKRQYPQVRLSKKGKSRNHQVSRLVALAFIPNPDSKAEVNHIDGVKWNNHVDNLEWSSRLENMAHAYENGLMNPVKGARKVNAKLNAKDVKRIRQMYATGDYLQRELGEMFNVSQVKISQIVLRKCWKHIK